MNFINYKFNRELQDFYTEIFHKDTFMNNVPENSYWKPNEPSDEEEGYEFYYSLPSDPQKFCGNRKQPCYSVQLSHGNISFIHSDTGVEDRWSYTKHNDNAMQIAREQINAILYAVGVYVQNVKPQKLSWTPIAKTDSSQNTDARKKVYFLWGAKNLWPDYLPISESSWIRKDVVSQHIHYPLPDNLDQMSAKGFLTWINDQKQQEREKARREEDEYRQRQQERIDQELQNPQINPNNVKLNDVVIVNDTENPDGRHNGKLYTITRFRSYYDGLEAYLYPYNAEDNGQTDIYPHNQTSGTIRMNIKFLHPNTENNMSARDRKVTQHKQEQERRKQELVKELLANPQANPNQLALGDEVFVHTYTNRQGMYGRIIDFQVNPNYRDPIDQIEAMVIPLRDNDYDQDYQSTKLFALDDLVKATPENRRIRQFNLPYLMQGRGYERIQKPDPNWRQPQTSTSSDPSPNGASIE